MWDTDQNLSYYLLKTIFGIVFWCFFFTIGSVAKGIKKKPSKSELQIKIYWHTGKPDGILLRKRISLYFLYFIVITACILS